MNDNGDEGDAFIGIKCFGRIMMSDGDGNYMEMYTC